MNRTLEPVSAHPEQAAGGEDIASEPAKLLRQFEICRELGIGVTTWREWRAAGRVPAPVPNLPGVPRWRVEDIEAFRRGVYRGPSTEGRRYFSAARRGR